MSRKQELTGLCQCAGCKPATAKARAAAAIRMLKTQRSLGRPFEHAFECEDADDVVRHVTREAANDPTLERRVRSSGFGYWLDPSGYAWLWEPEAHPFANRVAAVVGLALLLLTLTGCATTSSVVVRHDLPGGSVDYVATIQH